MNHGHTLTPDLITLDVEQRLRKLSRPAIEGECWIWVGQTRKNHPLISVGGRPRSARAVAWLIKHRQPLPPDGVSAGCGNDHCVNPEHQVARHVVKPNLPARSR